MIKRITGKWAFFVVVSVLIYMVCTEYSNPFQDQSLSKATAGTKTYQNSDTVLIFSSETVSVVTYLREHIKEVAVHIDNNRFWKLPDTVFHQEDLTGEPIVIPISFFRTGWNKITITTTFKNDETMSETDSLFARSPLAQQQITAMAGDSIHLKTEPVKDDDVLYVWDFRDGTVIKEYAPEVDFVLKNSLSSLVGELYVIDRSNYRSPSIYFTTTTGSGFKLKITPVNTLMQGDTVYTGESDFALKVFINGSFKSATINGLSFDNSQVSGNGFQLSKTFNKLETLSAPMKVSIVVEDKNNEPTEKILFIKYDVNQTSLPVISVTIPSILRDTSFVLDSSLHMYGKVTAHAQYDKLYMKFSQNGFPKGYYILLAGNDEWTHKLNLVAGWNKVRIELSKDSISSSSVIVSKEIQIKYDSTMRDIQPPKIRDIKVNGVAVAGDKSFTSSSPSAILTMIVSDNNGIKSVTVNNDTARVQQDGLTYSVSVNPEHKIGGTQYLIKATDVADNVRPDTVTGLFNSAPRIESAIIPSSMQIGSTYYIVVKASDSDSGDNIVKTITIKRPVGDSTITLVNDTAFWTPGVSDTGKNTIYIRVTDDFIVNYDDTTAVSTVYQKTDKPFKVSWLTSIDDFPDSIIVGKEQLTEQLKVTPNTGVGPFTYVVSIYNPSKVIYEGDNALFSWTPTRSDAGVRTLRCIVNDKNGESDTLDVLLNVIAHPAAIVAFTDQSMTINENSTNSAAVVRISTPIADSIKVPYTIKLKSATAPDLNMITSGIIWLAKGDTTVRLPINVVNDIITEPDELFTIELSDLPALSDNDSIAINKNKSTIEVTIRDDDMRTVKYSFDGSSASGSENAKADTIKVVLDTAFDKDLELTYSYDKTTLSANDSDFSFASTDHTLKFKAGVKEATFIILITNDTKPENDEVIKFKLQATDPAAIAGTYTTFEYTIVDDDGIVKVQVLLQPPTLSIPESGSPAAPGIYLTDVLKSDLTVRIKPNNNSSAKANSDYIVPSYDIVIPKGAKSQLIGFKLVRDFMKEPQEWVEFEIMSISDTANAVIDVQKTSRITILAD